jgi:DNA polymerase-3 subunit gamma/tau
MTSLYRRHRPQSFAEVVGQEPIVRTLGNAIERGKVHHAYLFVGSRGTGKTSIAKILARSLNCAEGPTLEPCGKCESCASIANGTSLDVIEMDAASNNSVDDIRDLREKVSFTPALGGWKVYILDEAHMLSTAAWNAFLKTLEEPPPHAIFVLATTEAHKVPATIVDRCHRFDFRRPSLEEILTVLRRVCEAERIEADDRGLGMVARAAQGSFRDALGTLDQLTTYGSSGEGKISFEDVLDLLDLSDSELIFAATDAIASHDPATALQRVAELAESGGDPVQFMTDLTEHLRQLVVTQTLGGTPDSFSVTADQAERIWGQAQALPRVEVVRTVDLLAAAIAATKEGSDPRIQLEVALLKAASPQVDASIEALFTRIERLERGGDAAGASSSSETVLSSSDAPGSSAPAAKPAAAAAGLEPPEEISVLWPAVLERMREAEGGELLTEYLSPARPVALEDDVLVLAYPQSASFSKRKLEHPANGERVADMLRLVAGRPLRIRVELTDDDSADQAATPEEIDEEELVRRIKDAFDAEEVTIGAGEAAVGHDATSEAAVGHDAAGEAG